MIETKVLKLGRTIHLFIYTPKNDEDFSVIVKDSSGKETIFLPRTNEKGKKFLYPEVTGNFINKVTTGRYYVSFGFERNKKYTVRIIFKSKGDKVLIIDPKLID